MAENKSKPAGDLRPYRGGQLNKLEISPERSRRTLDTLSTILFYLSILTFIIGFNFSDNRAGGWTQQFMPSNSNRPTTDITFLDSLNGYAVQSQDSSFILKTTNGGDSWQIIYRQLFAMTHVQFLNSNIGYAGGGYLYKTTNAGFNWTPINTPLVTVEKMFVLNQDTIWFVSSDPSVGGVFFTSTGGTSWINQLDIGANNPDRIYMYNARIGFVSGSGQLRKTTDGGANWMQISGESAFNDMFFTDSLTGWKSPPMKKTVNGGLNWVTQQLPVGGNLFPEGTTISNINKDTIWAGGGYKFFPGYGSRATLNFTSNGGDTWYFQLPDTSFGIANLPFIQFTDKLHGWAYGGTRGIHTITGGDTVWYTGIQQIANAVPEKFILKQNYPNPFNPRTVIPYSISSSAHVKIIAYDIQGREVQRMVDNNQHAGVYEVDFMGKFTSTGVYFYRMTVTDNKSRIVYTDTKKMVLLK